MTELYLTRRYFSDRQVQEALWIAALGTFRIRGGWNRRFLKGLVSLVLLPDTLWTLSTRGRAARRMMSSFPQIHTNDEEICFHIFGLRAKFLRAPCHSIFFISPSMRECLYYWPQHATGCNFTLTQRAARYATKHSLDYF